MQIVHKNTAELIPYINNARKHSEQQVAQIAGSIKEFGFNNPVLIDGANSIIAGHGRVLAAQKLGIEQVPTVELSHLTESQKRAYILADNRIAENAGWDDELLKLELLNIKDDFNLEELGFNIDDINNVLIAVDEREYGNEDTADAVPDANTDIKLGDIYQLGHHRIMCGDATNIEHIKQLLNQETPDLIYTDPPYGIKCVKEGGKDDGRIGSGGKSKDGKFYKATKFMPVTNDQSPDVGNVAIKVLEEFDCTKVYWGGNYFADHLPPSSCWLIWDKENIGSCFADAELAWTNHKGAVRMHRQLWSGFMRSGEEAGKPRIHPNQKPVALNVWAMEKVAKDALLVLDVFAGSGSTLKACEQTNRVAYLLEYEPAYVQMIINHWEERTGKKATLSEL